MQDASDSLIASGPAVAVALAVALGGPLPAAGEGEGEDRAVDLSEGAVLSVPRAAATSEGRPESVGDARGASPGPSSEPAPASSSSAPAPPRTVEDTAAQLDTDTATDTATATATALPEPAAASSVSLESSAASTPVLGAALLPAPTPSGSPAPPKKFHSSLSVNKKFLEKATEKGKPDPKAVVAARLATPPIVAPVSTSHPRLLTGKISAGTSLSLTTAQTVSGVSGWLKNTPAPGAEGTLRPALASQQDAAGLGRGATYERGRGGMLSAAGVGRGRGGAVWGKSSSSGGELNMGIGGDFPTAAEAASAKTLRTAALLEQTQSRDRAVQARAAAAAAANAHLLEGLDAFRGVHLDPNASHWDDDAEDDDFLDETIEFGDGTQYKIQDAHLEPPASGRDPNALSEPHPSEFATREAPLAPGESGAHEGAREERFKDDFDRSWPKRPVATDPKSIFNERLGKFELAAGANAGKKGAPGPILTHDGERPSHARAPSGSEHSNASVTSPRLDKAALPPLSGRREPPTSAWGRGEPAREWHAAGSAPTARRPSMEPQLRGRRPSNEPSVRRPSVSTVTGIDLGGRQLPPHLAVAHSAAQPPARNTHDRPAGPPPAHHAHPPSHSHVAQPLSPASATLSPPQSQKVALPPAEQPAAADAAPAPVQAPPPPPPVVDLEALHVREMHAAAERAKKRRQDEELQRLEQVERAKKKAAEIEEKIRVAAEAKAAEAAAKLPPPKPAAAPKPVPAARPAPESWRERATSSKAQAPVSAPASVAPGPAPASKPEPTQILARDPKSPTTATAKDAARPPIPKSTSSGPPPTEDRAWRRGDVVPAPAAEPAKTSNRQLPPHLANQAPPAAAPLSPPVPSATARVEPSPTAPLAPIQVPTTLDVYAPSSSAPSADGASLQIAHKGSIGSSTAVATAELAIKGAAFKKVPQISSFEDTMSRIKGAMGQPKEPAQDQVETVQRDHKSPNALPTVKLPTTTLALATALVTAAGHRPSESTPRGPRAAAQPRLSTMGPKQTRAEAKKAAALALPAFESREAMSLFDCSRIERPGSPPPAWKAYVVRLAMYPKLSYPRHKAVKAFHNPHEPARVQPLCVVPQHGGGGRRGQQELFYPSFTRGKINYTVLLSATRITRRTSIEMLPVSAFAPPPRKAAEATPSRAPEGSWRRDGVPVVNGADEALASVLESEDMLDATTAPSAASLFDPGPPRPTRAVKDRVPPGASIAFYRPPSVTPLEQTGVSKMFMVTSELDGEVVEMTPREFLAAPGADAAIQAPELTSTPPSDVPATTQALSPLSNGAWPSSTPLRMSVLDPTAPSVWSAPPTDSPVHARAVSLGGIQPENSLQGIADPDDFPAASIPTSLAELKSEDEGSSDGKPVVHKQAAKDEARLRAVAPSFSSYNELPSPHLESRTPRGAYPSFTRSPSYPQLPPSQSPVNYPQTYVPNPAYAQQAPQSHMYPSFSPQPQSSAPLYGAQLHQGFGGQGAFAAPPQLSSPQFSSYRAPNPINNTITNPALIAQGYSQNLSSYGPVGAASAFGPVGGAGGSRNNGSAPGAFRSPSMTPNYLQGAYAQQQHPYRSDYAGQDARQQQQPFGAPASAYGAQPLYHQPPQPFGGPGFSPQPQPMQAPGRGGPAGPGFRRY